MAKYVYTAIFTPDKSGYSVMFPDIDGCFTQGDSLPDAMEMAQDALELMLYDIEESGATIPDATRISDVSVPDGSFTTYISCDTTSYRNKTGDSAPLFAAKA